MAHPHPTPDVPGTWPHLRDEVARCAVADSHSVQLLAGLDSCGDDDSNIATGHVCATTWVFDPTGRFMLLVRHRLFGWSAPGGHIEPDETSFEGGLRELEEETGLTRFDVVPILDRPALVHVSDLSGERPHRHWNIAWLYSAEMDSPLSQSEGAQWWPVGALPPGPPDLVHTSNQLLGLLAEYRDRQAGRRPG